MFGFNNMDIPACLWYVKWTPLWWLPTVHWIFVNKDLSAWIHHAFRDTLLYEFTIRFAMFSWAFITSSSAKQTQALSKGYFRVRDFIWVDENVHKIKITQLNLSIQDRSKTFSRKQKESRPLGKYYCGTFNVFLTSKETVVWKVDNEFQVQNQGQCKSYLSCLFERFINWISISIPIIMC